MKTLALDIATKTGWATNINGKHSGVVDFKPKRGDSPGMRYLKCRAWLSDMTETFKDIELVIYEQPHYRGGHATEVCVGLVTEVQAWCADNNINHTSLHSMSLKKFATGKGNASKKEMIAAAKTMGWQPKDDNEADAQCLLEFAMAEY